MSDEQKKRLENPDLNINSNDALQTQRMSSDFEADLQLDNIQKIHPYELDTRPAIPGLRRMLLLHLPQEKDPLVFFNLEVLTMGRGGENVQIDLNLSDNGGWLLGVSRKHATLTYLDDNYYIIDLGSTNGTFLNGKRLEPNKQYLVESADQIRLGHLNMIVSTS